MHIITRTIYGSRLQSQLLLGLPYTPAANTTLNERFDVQAGIAPPNGEVPRVRYFGIGNGGHRNMTGADGIPYVSPIQHSPADACAYRPLPFLLREPSNDLTVTERQKYAMRKEEVINGQNYIAYYLKRMDFSDVVPQMLHNSVADGVTTTTPFVPSGANLNPTPPAISPTGVVTTSGDYLSTSALLGLGFTAADVAELVEVARIMYDNELYAVISEIMLVAGVDKIVTATGPGGVNFNYEEAIAATVVTHITAHYSVGYTNNGFDYDLDLGATEPLVGLANV
jgi:hypothetical protein